MPVLDIAHQLMAGSSVYYRHWVRLQQDNIRDLFWAWEAVHMGSEGETDGSDRVWCG